MAPMIGTATQSKKSAKKITTRNAEKETFVEQAKLMRVLELIAFLKNGRWTVGQLAQRFNTSSRTIYRYLKLLEAVNFTVEQDFHNRYFLVTTEEEKESPQFTVEETSLLSRLIQSGIRRNPLKASLLKKLALNSALDSLPGFILKMRNARMVEVIAGAMKEKKQVLLSNYHSANSKNVRDRLIEPIRFDNDYQSVLALDVADKKSKQFKLDRIGEAILHPQTFQYEALHQNNSPDLFGMTGDTTTLITLKLNLRSYLLLREEFPLAIPYLEKLEDQLFQFHGPIKNFEGIARFVMGLSDGVSVLGPTEFIEFIKLRLQNQVLVK